jgi:hypothetical protein
MSDPQHTIPDSKKEIGLDTNPETITKPAEQPTIETPRPTEGAVEFTPENPQVKKEEENFLEESINTLKGKLRGNKKKPTTVTQVRDELTIQVEKVMEDGLADAFRELTPIQKQEFKIKGEQTAFAIRALLKKSHIKAKEIFKLIMEWLKLLPGINKFFLEQEAKIKTDKIIALKKTSGK